VCKKQQGFLLFGNFLIPVGRIFVLGSFGSHFGSESLFRLEFHSFYGVEGLES
jgi:hypothetical protein